MRPIYNHIAHKAHLLHTPAQREAARLRAVLHTLPRHEVLRMVCTERERECIARELTATERARVELLTAWPWGEPALASTALAAAA